MPTEMVCTALGRERSWARLTSIAEALMKELTVVLGIGELSWGGGVDLIWVVHFFVHYKYIHIF